MGEHDRLALRLEGEVHTIGLVIVLTLTIFDVI